MPVGVGDLVGHHGLLVSDGPGLAARLILPSGTIRPMGSAGQGAVDERAPADLAGAPAEPVSPPDGTRNDRWLGLGQALLIAVPSLIVIAVVAGRSWGPASDYAVMVMRTSDVFGRHTPLLGVVSRNHGWYHPGPSQYWLMAPFQWAMGVTGTLVAVGLANLAALVGAVVVARRRWRARSSPASRCWSASCWSGRSARRSSSIPGTPGCRSSRCSRSCCSPGRWPTVTSGACRGRWASARTSCRPRSATRRVVLGLSGTAVVLLLVDQRTRLRQFWTAARKPLVVAALVGVAFWIAPLIQQLTGHPGNISALISYFRHPSTPAVGFHQGIRQWGEEFSLPGPWLTGHDTGFLGFVAYRSPVVGLLLVAATLVLGVVAWRLGKPSAGRFAVLTSVAALVGIDAIANITDTVANYLVRWAWVVAASLWMSILWSLWTVLARRLAPGRAASPAGGRRGHVRRRGAAGHAAPRRRAAPTCRRCRRATRSSPSSPRAARLSTRTRTTWCAGPTGPSPAGWAPASPPCSRSRASTSASTPWPGSGMGRFRVLSANDADAMVIVYDLGNAGPGWKPLPGARRIAALRADLAGPAPRAPPARRHHQCRRQQAHRAHPCRARHARRRAPPPGEPGGAREAGLRQGPVHPAGRAARPRHPLRGRTWSPSPTDPIRGRRRPGLPVA